ncbi:MAG TPA: SDR family oxidoreductase [Chloroflexota bacterium]|nr:SDR family oxidoreductase [Chloroflexota bacterium]
METTDRRSLSAVVITGASTGIGRACALHLDRLGFTVFAGVRREADGEVLKSMSSGLLVPILLDVTVDASVEQARQIVAAKVGDSGLVGLINNAGIAIAGPIEFLPIEDLRRQFDVNVVGQVRVTQAFLPLLRTGRGRIVNVGSIAGRNSLPFIGAYNASKSALASLTDALRVELRPWGIEVSLIEPSSIATPIWEKSLATAEEIFADSPPAATALYGPALGFLRAIGARAGTTAVSTDQVVRAVVHALTAKRPKTRYLVGKSVRLRVAFTLLPDRMRDWLVARMLPRYGR